MSDGFHKKFGWVGWALSKFFLGFFEFFYWRLKLWSGNLLLGPTCSLLAVTSRHWSVARRTFRDIVTSGHVISEHVISGHVISGQARFRTALFQVTMYRQFARKVGTSTNSPLIRYYLLRLKLSSSTRDCDYEWTNRLVHYKITGLDWVKAKIFIFWADHDISRTF